MSKFAHLYLKVDEQDRPEVSAEHLRRDPIDGDATVNIMVGPLVLEIAGPRSVLEDMSADLARALVKDRAEIAAERSSSDGLVPRAVDPVAGGAGTAARPGSPADLTVVPT